MVLKYFMVSLALVLLQAASATDFKPARIAMIQYNGDRHFGDRTTNLLELSHWVDEAIRNEAKIIIMPEGSLYGYASPDAYWCRPGMTGFRGRPCRDVSTVAEAIPDGPTTQYWAQIARESQTYIVYQIPEVDQGHYYASVGVVGPTGFVTRYRKRALYWVDTAFAEPGTEATVLETPYGRFGLMICMDATAEGPLYEGYRSQSVNGILLSMDWDDDPAGPYAASSWFMTRARTYELDIFAADSAPWDGAGAYLSGGLARSRQGLAGTAIGVDGVTYHDINY